MPEDKGRRSVPEDSADNATTDPEQTVEGQSFYNPALTGSGTIVDGEYEAPEPDPTQVRGLGPDRTSGGRPLQHLGGLRRDAEAKDAEDKDAEDKDAEDKDADKGGARSGTEPGRRSGRTPAGGK